MTTDLARTIRDARSALRADRMIYQAELKRRAAEHNSVPFSAYALLPYPEWDAIRAEYLRTHDMQGRPRVSAS